MCFCILADSDVCISLKCALFILFLLVLHCHETYTFCSALSSNVYIIRSFKVLHCHEACALFEPAHEIMVLIAYANSESSGTHAHLRSLFRAFAHI